MRALLLVSILLTSPSWAAEPRARVALTAGLRVDAGVGSDAGLTLGLGALGLDWHVADTLVLSVSALGLVPFGSTDAGEASNAGLGGALSMRLVPFPGEVLEPFVTAGIGLLFFGRDAPFLPGGDVYEGILTYGLGLDVRLDAVTLGAQIHYTHLSNGQGLGPHNPAFDGLGLSVVARIGLSPPELISSAWDRYPEPSGGRPCFQPGWTLDGSYGRVADEALWTGRLRLAERLSASGLVLLDVEAGTLAAERLIEAGVAIVEHVDVATFGVHVGYRDFIGLGTVVAAIQAEVHVSAQVSIVALGVVEGAELSDPIGLAGVGLRVFPFPTVLVDLGVGFDRIGQADLDDLSDPYLGLEWQIPVDLGDWQFSLFLERQISTVDTFGLRIAFTGAGHLTLRDVARHTDWRRLR